jgi:hypothetical protein
MNNYNIITYATLNTEYKIKAKNEEEAREKYYSGEWYDSNELDIHDEQIDTIEIDVEYDNET